ncbi:MAG TPA: DUF805 domain-containing protein [Thermohalobaculum sp.]|nr:DUF805 domain-containing protein [Thermohalobaculum sp.]
MTFDEAVLRCLSKYAVFAGRARPSEFWWFMALFASALGLTALSASLAPGLLAILLAICLALTVPALAVTVRRLHDIGVEGWMLVFLVPVLGQMLMLVWLAKPSVPRLNRHGPEPSKRRERMLLFAR